MQNVKDAELAKNIARTKATREALADAQKELANVEASFQFALATQKVKWAREEQETTSKIEALHKELADLEKQKIDALIPIEVLAKNAHNLMEEAERALAKAEEKQRQNDNQGELLEEKIDGITEKEEELAQREAKLVVKEKAVEAQSEMVKNLSADLTKKVEEFLKQT